MTLSTAPESGVLPDNEVAYSASMMRVLFYAEATQLVPPTTEPGVDPDNFKAAINALAARGIARGVVTSDRTIKGLNRIAARVLDSIEASPNPSIEWNLTTTLGDQLAPLVGTSVTSMHRYRAGGRQTPDDVAARLHLVAQIVTDLTGSYNEYGIRRWFDRSRSALGGRSPSEVFTDGWDPESADAQLVRRLAHELTA